MTLGFGKNSGNFYVAIDLYNTVAWLLLRGKCYILKGNYISLNCNRVLQANIHNTDYHTSMSHSILHCHPFLSTIHTLDGRIQFHHYNPIVPQINHRSHNQHHHLICQCLRSPTEPLNQSLIC